MARNFTVSNTCYTILLAVNNHTEDFTNNVKNHEKTSHEKFKQGMKTFPLVGALMFLSRMLCSQHCLISSLPSAIGEARRSSLGMQRYGQLFPNSVTLFGSSYKFFHFFCLPRYMIDDRFRLVV